MHARTFLTQSFGAALLATAVVSCRDSLEPLRPRAPSLELNTADAAPVTVVYSNFGPGMTFNASAWWAVFNGPGVLAQAMSQQFTPAASYALHDVQIAARWNSGSDSLWLYLQEDAAGFPGPVLESIPLGRIGATPSVVTGRSRIGPVLRAGVPYWLSVFPGAVAGNSGWMVNSIGDASSTSIRIATGTSVAPSGPWFPLIPVMRSAFQVTGTPPAFKRKPVTLDALTPTGGTTLPIGGPGVRYSATLSNRTPTRRALIALEGWIEQAGARRPAGGQLVSCGTELGVLPPGTCVQTGGLVASTDGTVTGKLVPGPAHAIVQVVRIDDTGRTTLDARSFPVLLVIQQGVLSVDVSPTDVQLPSPGATTQLTARVLVVGGAPTTVQWVSSNPAVAWVSGVTGVVTALRRGGTLITATSTADPSKSATALVSVGTQASFGNGVNVSPGTWQLSIGRTVQLAAQVVGAPSAVSWTSPQPHIAAVSSFGQVTGVSPGMTTLTATSVADPSKSAATTIVVYDYRISAPTIPTNVSTGATSPPTNPVSVPLSARACGPPNLPQIDIARTEFLALVGAAWTPIGSSTSPLIVDNGISRCWTWTFTWTPGMAFGTGPQTIMAKGWDLWGIEVAATQVNTSVTITDP